MNKDILTGGRQGYVAPATTHACVRHDWSLLASSKEKLPEDNKMKGSIEQQAGGQTFTVDWDTQPIS